MGDGAGAVLRSVSEYADAVGNIGGGQFTSQFTESGRRFFAAMYGAPFFAIDRLAPELKNRATISVLIADSIGSLAADGGRWLSLYSKALLPRKIACTVCVAAKPRPTKAPKPLLFQPSQQVLIKNWGRHLQALDKQPDVLVLYIPDGFDAIASAIDELSRLVPGRKTLLTAHSQLEALLIRSLLASRGFQTGDILGFDKSEGEQQHFAAGAWWFSAVTPTAGGTKQPDNNYLDSIRDAYQIYRTFIQRAKTRNEVEQIATAFATPSSDTVEGQADIKAVRILPQGGIDMSTGRFFSVREDGGDSDASFAWEERSIGPDLLARAPATDDRLQVVVWLAQALTEAVRREETKEAEPTPAEAPKDANAQVEGDAAPSVPPNTPPATTDAKLASDKAAAPNVAPEAKPRLQRSRLSRSAGTVNVLALAARLGKGDEQPGMAFDSARSRILGWLKSKGFVVTDPSRNSQIELPDGEAIIETDGQSVWALRLDDRRSMSEGAIWRVEATLLGTDAPAISVRLAQIRSTEDASPPIASGVPSVVAGIAKEVGLQDAGVPLLNTAVRLAGDKDFASLGRLLLNPHRCQPVIVVSTSDSTRADPTVDRLATRLAGVAHVVAINGAVSDRMIRSFGRERSIYGNAIRLYRPGFTAEADQYQHPVWAMKGTQLPKWIANDIFEEACAISLEVGDLEERAPSFQMVRNHLAEQRLASSEQRLVELRQQAESIASSKDDQIVRLKAIRDELEAALTEYKAKYRDLADQATALEGELQATRRERDAALAEARQLRYQLDNRWVDEQASETELANESYYPDTWDELEEWVEIYGEDKLVLHPQAAKAARKSNFKDIPLAYKAMEYLVRHYIPMRTRNKDDTEAYTRSQQALAELGLEESDVGTAQDIKRYKREYTRLYEGNEVKLDRHIKDGVGFGGEYQFRLYFYYDDEATKVLIGHLPTHLTNRLSHNG